ncbi:MAG: MerR family transcriptional regulator, partial [Planctomycetaceae bacterium]
MTEESNLLEGRFYTMGEVERATGVPAATLRAWERRYGVPIPGRSSGRHRLYSEDDLLMLRWLLARQKEGMSISRAVAAWRYQSTRRGPAAARAGVSTETTLGLASLRSAWVEACLRYDRALAESILSQAFALYPAGEVCTELLLGGLSSIGEAWFKGEATVHQEHFASAVATHQVEKLIGATAPWRRERVLLACPPGELHAFGLLFLALLLRQRGLNTVLLGASVPVERLDAAVAEA